MQLWFASALTAKGWADDVRITVSDGRLATLEAGTPPSTSDQRYGVALPGLPNLHSHAFQRGMAGLTETAGGESDSFWSWRELMYRFLERIEPHDMEAIAAMAFAEMLEGGFTRVGEFHYVHHQIDGSFYDDPAELMTRIAAASDETGIALTLLPVFYAHSGFGGQTPLAGQRRFISSLDQYASLLDGARRAIDPLNQANVGVAPHSLRAVTPGELKAVAALAAGGPVHIHIAEQTKEVEDCLAWSGARPVDWLFDHVAVDEHWCLIHATHANAGELARCAKANAVIGLCPLTEANLGDGAFSGRDFLQLGGRFGLGSDSNVLVSLPGEIAMLEYSQRLTYRSRNVLSQSPKSTGRSIFDAAYAGGTQALGRSATGLAVDGPADIVALRLDHNNNASHIRRRQHDAVLDAWIFSGRPNDVESVWRNGRQLVRDGIHVDRDAIERRFHMTIDRLMRE